jgi:hypothetical protein
MDKKERFCTKCGVSLGKDKMFSYVCFDCKLKQKKECNKKYRERMGESLKEKKKKAYRGLDTSSSKELICKECKKSFLCAGWRNPKFCSHKCFTDDAKKSRIGKKNPSYRNGLATKKAIPWKTYNTKHLRSCSKYRKHFLEKNDYLFCEHCKINQSIKFEVHHIVFASEKPRHEYLHDFRNLIMVCINCHNNFHKAGGKEMRKYLVEDRKLVELFGKDIL